MHLFFAAILNTRTTLPLFVAPRLARIPIYESGAGPIDCRILRATFSWGERMNRPITLGNQPEHPADIRLVEFLAALGDGRDQRISEAAAPMAADLSGQGQGQAGLLRMTHTIGNGTNPFGPPRSHRPPIRSRSLAGCTAACRSAPARLRPWLLRE